MNYSNDTISSNYNNKTDSNTKDIAMNTITYYIVHIYISIVLNMHLHLVKINMIMVRLISKMMIGLKVILMIYNKQLSEMINSSVVKIYKIIICLYIYIYIK